LANYYSFYFDIFIWNILLYKIKIIKCKIIRPKKIYKYDFGYSTKYDFYSK